MFFGEQELNNKHNVFHNLLSICNKDQVEQRKWLRVLAVILHEMTRESFNEQVTFVQRFEGVEAVGHADICGRSVPGRGNSECIGPRARVRHSETACRLAVLESSGTVVGQIPGPVNLLRDLGFYSE